VENVNKLQWQCSAHELENSGAHYALKVMMHEDEEQRTRLNLAGSCKVKRPYFMYVVDVTE